jgi:hypothetical protein
LRWDGAGKVWRGPDMVGKGKELVTHALSDERNSAPLQQGPRHQVQTYN